MPEYRSSGRDPRRDYNERPVRSSARPSGSRPAQGGRPSQGRRPAPRRKKRAQGRFYVILAAVVAVLVIALVLIIGFGGGNDPVQPMATPVPSANNGPSNVTISSQQPIPDTAQTAANSGNVNYSTLSQWLGDEDADISAITNMELVQVSDLSINPNLPSEWTNILLLGTDERTLTESSRTDTMIICSINPKTGEVKLSSILRAMAVHFDDIGDLNGTYRINSANFFGGPEYAIKTVNECFGLNIQHYVSVNFFGFQKVAEALGGIEVNISEAEMNEINKKQYQQYKIATAIGEEAPHVDKGDLLETYGPNTHLNGHQTLAYARVRNVDSDISRAERQRTVLIKLMEKLKGKSAAEIIALVGSLSGNVATNMDLNKITEIAITVLSSGISGVETFRVPVAGTFKEERRNDQAMLYDCDWTTNTRELYNFIYE